MVAAVGQSHEETAALLELLAGESLFFDVPAAQTPASPSSRPRARDWHGGRVRVRFSASRRRAFVQCTTGTDPASLAALAASASSSSSDELPPLRRARSLLSAASGETLEALLTTFLVSHGRAACTPFFFHE